MGNRKFKFSEIIPNAWFFKLKEMGAKTHHPGKKKPSPPPPQPPQETESPVPYSRKSYHFTRDLNLPPLDPPRKSSKKKRPTSKKPPTKSFSSGSSSSSASPGGETCVLIDVDNKSLGRKTEDSVSKILKLPPIKTERQRFDELVKEIGEAVEAIDVPVKVKKNSVKNENLPVKLVREEESFVFKEQGIRPVRRLLTTSPRVRVRINSPRIARRTQVNSSKGSVRKNISSDSMAVVKSSSDPKKDFRESMVEMIVENNIRASKDLEELLACYLSLNSNEYHDVIIQVFKQIWFDLNNSTRLSEVVAS